MNPESDPSKRADALQFDRAEFTQQSGPACASCKQPITNRYYEGQGQMVCEPCAEKLGAVAHGNRAERILRAVGAGIAAAVAGFLVYWLILVTTGYEFGLVAILVGWMVGKAVSWGSHHRGGPAYQALAVVLTYIAIASTVIPGIVTALKTRQAEAATTEQLETSPQSSESTNAAASTRPAQKVSSEISTEQWISMTPRIISFAIQSPFVDIGRNIIGLVILAIGLWQAWKMNVRVQVDLAGPYQVAPPAPGA